MKMKKRIAFLLTLLCVLACLNASVAEETVTPADQPFENETVERAHLIAQEKLENVAVYDPRLYTCTADTAQEGTMVFSFKWKYSNVAIYTVSVPENLDEDQTKVIYNTDHSMDDYYGELCSAFCPEGGFFGDWTLEQKAWLSSVIDAHWELEVFRTHTVNAEWMPYKYPLFDRLLEKERCGLPDENCISETAALLIAARYAEQNQTLSSLKPWKKTQTFYLINNPDRPVWCIRFWKDIDHVYDVTMDAHTGEIQKCSKMEV